MATSVWDLVKNATSDMLLEVDWSLNMQICDIVKAKSHYSEDFARALVKRLEDKKQKTQMLALELLATMMKNCGLAFYEQIHSKWFQKTIKKVVQKEFKKNGKTELHDRILSLVEIWSEVFSSQVSKFPRFLDTFNELKSKDFDFPPKHPDDIFELDLTVKSARREPAHHPRPTGPYYGAPPAPAGYGTRPPAYVQVPPGYQFAGVDAYVCVMCDCDSRFLSVIHVQFYTFSL
jgi:hypothetical protein